jgi:ribosomal protein S4
MARHFLFPDVNDRSVNSPSVVVSQAQVIGIYQQDVNKDQQKVTEPVREWFKGKAKEAGWHSAEFHGSQCVLTAKIKSEK